MWDVIKNAVTQLKDTLGIEIPGLPELPVDPSSLDLAALGDAATTAAQGATDAATEAATGAVEDLTTTAGEAVTSAGTQVTEAVSEAVSGAGSGSTEATR